MKKIIIASLFFTLFSCGEDAPTVEAVEVPPVEKESVEDLRDRVDSLTNEFLIEFDSTNSTMPVFGE